VVRAKVLHPIRGTSFSVAAVAHFTPGGDVAFSLRRAGKSYSAVGKVRVPAGQTASTVNVDITITYGGVVQPKIERVSKITIP
jgi:hypothetical protein